MCQHVSPSATGLAADAPFERSFLGHYSQLFHIRALMSRLLDGYPMADDTILLISELCANAVAHSASGRPGGTFTIRARRFSTTGIYAEVEDQGSPWDGDVTSAEPPHGLFLLRELAADYGARHSEQGWVIWFTITGPDDPAGVDQP